MIVLGTQASLMLHTLQVDLVLVEERVQSVNHVCLPICLILIRLFGLDSEVTPRAATTNFGYSSFAMRTLFSDLGASIPWAGCISVTRTVKSIRDSKREVDLSVFSIGALA